MEKKYTKQEQHIITLLETENIVNLELAEQLCKGQKLNFDVLLEEVFVVSFFMEIFLDKLNEYKEQIEKVKVIIENGYLKTLNLRSSQLSVLPENIGKLNKLEYLSLEELPLSTLPIIMSKLQNLKELYLSDLELGKLAEEMLPNCKIEYV